MDGEPAVLSPERPLGDLAPRPAGRPRAGAQDLPAARAWLGLSLLTLLTAGLFAVLLVLGRLLPLLGVTAGGGFFRRCLVVHVDMALNVWFFAYLGALVALLPCRAPLRGLAHAGAILAAAGVALLVTGLANTSAAPILCNYIPVLDHPLHMVALAVFALGLAVALADGRLLPGREAERGDVPLPPAARVGIRAAGLAVVIALATLVAAAASTPPGLLAETRYELLFWGPGHVLQAASACAMASVWILLLTPALGEAPVGRGAANALFGLIVLPLLGAPLLAAAGTTEVAYHAGFTDLMRYGLAPALLVLLGLCARGILRARRAGRLPRPLDDPRVMGFLASAGLTALGVAFGAAIAGSNTVIPAHYHASVGGVTAAFMAFTYSLLGSLGAPVPERLVPLCRWQPVLYGVGQVVFAIGFGLSGMYGLARKAYGTAQVVRSATETFGLWVMGSGGAVAVTGGALFIFVVGAALRARCARARDPLLEVA